MHGFAVVAVAEVAGVVRDVAIAVVAGAVVADGGVLTVGTKAVVKEAEAAVVAIAVATAQSLSLASRIKSSTMLMLLPQSSPPGSYTLM